MMDFEWRPSVETALRCISTFSGLREQSLHYQKSSKRAISAFDASNWYYQKSSPFRLGLLQLQLAILLLRCLSERESKLWVLREWKTYKKSTLKHKIKKIEKKSPGLSWERCRDCFECVVQRKASKFISAIFFVHTNLSKKNFRK